MMTVSLMPTYTHTYIYAHTLLNMDAIDIFSASKKLLMSLNVYINFSANILLDSKFVAKIGDCGTVREGPRGNKTSTRTQANIGTCPYMPKEYLEDYEVSVKMDAYSLGVVCFKVKLSFQIRT